MTWNVAFFSAAALIVLAACPGSQIISDARASQCAAGEKIDGSSAAAAMRKMKSAGFHQVRDLRKGCDNFWHGVAVKDGGETRVVLSPQGEVTREGN